MWRDIEEAAASLIVDGWDYDRVTSFTIPQLMHVKREVTRIRYRRILDDAYLARAVAHADAKEFEKCVGPLEDWIDQEDKDKAQRKDMLKLKQRLGKGF